MKRIVPTALATTAFVLSTGSVAWADGGSAMPAQIPKAYVQECGACHTAYPPGLLPKSSWQRITSGLDKHYGTDATLDDATLKQLSRWLQDNAGTYRKAGEEPPEDRITRSRWFVREHRDIQPAVWKLPSVKSAANCSACHTRADQGSFRERDIRYPAGLDPKYRWPLDD